MSDDIELSLGDESRHGRAAHHGWVASVVGRDQRPNLPALRP